MPEEVRILCFLALCAGFALAAWGVNRRWLSAERLSEDALQVFLLAVAFAVAAGTGLGLTGSFQPIPSGIVAGALGLLGVVLLARTRPRIRLPADRLTPAARAALCLGVGTVIGHVVLLWPAPSLLTDTLTYHLAFPARWLQEGRIVRVPAEYQAGAHAYFPVNQEVLCVWWMLPFHSEVMARFIQVPFLGAAALAVYVLTTARGLSRDAGAALAGAFLLFRPLLDQAIGGAYNDVTVSALLLVALHACDVARADRLRGSVLFGVALGLFVGTKYIAVPYSLPLLFAFLLTRPGLRNSLLAALLAVLLGGAWYAWTWLQTGDPIYPGDLAFGGVCLAKGLYDGRLFASHRSWEALREGFIGTNARFALTPVLAVALCACWLASHGRKKGTFAASTMPLVLVILYVVFVPLTDSRYLVPAFATLALSAGAAATLLGPRWSLLLPVALAGIAFREDIAPEAGAVLPRACLIAAGALFVLWWLARLLPLRGMGALGAAGGALLVVMGAWPYAEEGFYEEAYGTKDRRATVMYSLENGDEGRAWQWWFDATRDAPATIAYAGTGHALPLFGERLKNRVLYVPVREGPVRLVHEYGERLDKGNYRPLPDLSPLEVAEGILRESPDRIGWNGRLEREGVEYLLVTGAERDGAPLLERRWAEQDPARFQEVFRSGATTVVYRIRR